MTTPDQVGAAIRAKPAGTTFAFVVRRDGATVTEQVTSAPGRKDPAVPYVGVVVAVDYQATFPITFGLEDVGGPSAGLMFSLGIVDKLTPGELNGGRFVAGTGTITPEGDVGPIGGIGQKMAGARGQGAELFLAPKDNCPEALENGAGGTDRHAGDDTGRRRRRARGLGRGSARPLLRTLSGASSTAGRRDPGPGRPSVVEGGTERVEQARDQVRPRHQRLLAADPQQAAASAVPGDADRHPHLPARRVTGGCRAHRGRVAVGQVGLGRGGQHRALHDQDHPRDVGRPGQGGNEMVKIGAGRELVLLHRGQSGQIVRIEAEGCCEGGLGPGDLRGASEREEPRWLVPAVGGHVRLDLVDDGGEGIGRQGVRRVLHP